MNLIAEKGFHGAPMSEIASKAGVSVGIIYHYFDSKDDLIKQLHGHIKQKFAQALLVGDDEYKSNQERFFNLWRNMINHLTGNSAEHAFIQQFDTSPYEQLCYTEEHFVYFADTVKLIEQGIQTGVFKSLPVAVIMETTFALASAVTRLEANADIEIDEAMLEITAQIAWDAIVKHDQ